MVAAHARGGHADLCRQRVTLLGKIGAVSGVCVVLVQLFLAFSVEGYARPFGAITLLLVAAPVAPSLMYLICRNPECSPRVVRNLETATVLASAGLYSATLLFFDVQHHFDRLAILALTFIAVLRATLVPSGVVRTIVITAAMAVPLVVFVALSYQDYVPRSGDPLGATHTPVVMAGWTIIWWSFTTLLSAMISGSLTDLRRHAPSEPPEG